MKGRQWMKSDRNVRGEFHAERAVSPDRNRELLPHRVRPATETRSMASIASAPGTPATCLTGRRRSAFDGRGTFHRKISTSRWTATVLDKACASTGRLITMRAFPAHAPARRKWTHNAASACGVFALYRVQYNADDGNHAQVAVKPCSQADTAALIMPAGEQPCHAMKARYPKPKRRVDPPTKDQC